jgi:very-short-patch-repair endonuclease
MVWSDVQRRDERARAAWDLVRCQHGVVSRRQLLELGFSRRAIEHRLVTGRLHPIRPGVYAVGRREITREAEWMAAVLGLRASRRPQSRERGRGFGHTRPRQPGVRVHRRASFGRTDLALVGNIPVTGPACTLIDLAARLGTDQLEAAINEADKLDLIDPETLRDSLSDVAPRPGLAVLGRTLDAQTFTLTDTELERRFLQIVREVGLPEPLTQRWVNGFRVDFYWPDLGLVVETDGLRYHRTPAAQARDRLRDQARTAAGLTPLRFTRAQVRFQEAYVRRILADVAGRLG